MPPGEDLLLLGIGPALGQALFLDLNREDQLPEYVVFPQCAGAYRNP
jgi:hypothetical protein